MPSNTKYQLFRHNKTVFAVRYENQEPVESIEMWKSHNKESKPLQKQRELGKGMVGQVYEKTPDKAVKKFEKSSALKPPSLEESGEINLMLLDQKFLLRHHGLDKYFLLGLFNNKNKAGDGKVIYIMPQLTEISPNSQYRKSFEEFICALKKVNDLGLAHPDYCANTILYHTNFDNAVYTKDGMKLVDLDSGFEKIDLGECPFERDQWLIAYNYYKQNDRDAWLDVLKQWYDDNPKQALSDNPEALLAFFDKKIISVPDTIVNELRELQAKKITAPPEQAIVQEKVTIHIDQLDEASLDYFKESSIKICNDYIQMRANDAQAGKTINPISKTRQDMAKKLVTELEGATGRRDVMRLLNNHMKANEVLSRAEKASDLGSLHGDLVKHMTILKDLYAYRQDMAPPRGP